MKRATPGWQCAIRCSAWVAGALGCVPQGVSDEPALRVLVHSESTGDRFDPWTWHTLRAEVSALDGSLVDAVVWAEPALEAPSVVLSGRHGGSVEVRMRGPVGPVRVWAQTYPRGRAGGDEVTSAKRRMSGVSESIPFVFPTIGDTQQSGDASPIAGHVVVFDERLVVSHVRHDGFYVLSLPLRPYAALFVYTGSRSAVAPCDELDGLTGRIEEFYGLTELVDASFVLARGAGVDTEQDWCAGVEPTTLARSSIRSLEAFESALVVVDAADPGVPLDAWALGARAVRPAAGARWVGSLRQFGWGEQRYVLDVAGVLQASGELTLPASMRSRAR